MTADKDMDDKAEELKVENVVLEDDNCRHSVNAKMYRFVLTVEGTQDVA